MNQIQTFLGQLDAVLDTQAIMRNRAKHTDLSDLPKDEQQALVTRAIAAVHRITGLTSTYSTEVNRVLKESPAIHVHTPYIIGIVRGLKDDVAAGYLKSLVELVHATVFADFLEMSSHLSGAGYKDAAAVVCGSTLESHLHELCNKHGIPLEANGKPKKADLLNSELAKFGAYSALDQKNVTAWLGLRNSAAHGDYQAYTADQVELLISGVRDFLVRTPA